MNPNAKDGRETYVVVSYAGRAVSLVRIFPVVAYDHARAVVDGAVAAFRVDGAASEAEALAAVVEYAAMLQPRRPVAQLLPAVTAELAAARLSIGASHAQRHGEVPRARPHPGVPGPGPDDRVVPELADERA